MAIEYGSLPEDKEPHPLDVQYVPMASQEAESMRLMRLIKWLIISFTAIILAMAIIIFFSVFYYEEETTTTTTVEQAADNDGTNNFAGGDISGYDTKGNNYDDDQ